MSGSVNQFAAPQTNSRQVFLRVLGNGAEIPGAKSANVTSNGNYQADRFSLQFALNAQPNGMVWWGNQDRILIDVQMVTIDASSDASTNWVSIVQGEVDHIQLSPAGGLVMCQGRDLTQRFIDSPTQEAFKNQTSSEVATTLAARHGMTAQVTATTTMISRYYQDDHDKLTLGQFSRTTTEWDLLCYLARMEGFDCFVQGTTLYFQPVVSDNADPYTVLWTPPDPSIPYTNAIDLRLERSLTLARDIQVTVRSWQARGGRGFSKVIRAKGTKSSSATNSLTQNYVFVRPNLTEDQALKFGQNMLTELTKHERVISFRRPGDLLLTPRSLVQFIGTNSSWDQNYYVDTIDRSISFEGGFTMNVRCKNSSPLTQTVVS